MLLRLQQFQISYCLPISGMCVCHNDFTLPSSLWPTVWND